jgi:hypothetical protein
MMEQEYNECSERRLWKSCGWSVHILCTARHEKKKSRARVRQQRNPSAVDVLSRAASLDRGVTLP